MITRFKGQNHPQQIAKRGVLDQVDDRGTDAVFFAGLYERFEGFTLDVAAAPHNAKCPVFYTREDDGLLQPWYGRVWCNPPYSDLRAWVQKAWNEWWEPGGPRLIVMLVPANRTEQAWWQDLVEPDRDSPGSCLRVEFIRSRLRFDRPAAEIGPKGDRPPFGCCLLIWQLPPRSDVAPTSAAAITTPPPA